MLRLQQTSWDRSYFYRETLTSFINIHIEQIYDYAKYVGFQKYGILNCCVCRNYVDSYNGLGKICRLYKHLQIPQYETLDTSRAKSCHCFMLNKEDMEQKLKNGAPAPYDIL